MKITEKLALDAFKNDKDTHITLDQKICHTCKERFCIYACPANLYSLNERGRWWSNSPVVWNVAPARSPVSMALSNGNIPGVDSVFNIALDDGKQINLQNAVALVRYRPETTSFAQTLDLFQGLQGVPANTKIPNKPKKSHGKRLIKHSIWIQRIFLKGENNGIQDD